MLKYLILIAVGVSVLLFAFKDGIWGTNPAEAPHDRADLVIPELTPQQQRGEVAFAANCAACHGENAGGTDQGPAFLSRIYHPRLHADGAFLLAMRRGVQPHHWSFGKMPRQSAISDDDGADIVSYVRALQRANGYAPPLETSRQARPE